MHCGARGDFPSRKGTLPLAARAWTPKRYEQSSSDLELGLSWRIVAVLGVIRLSAEVRLSRKSLARGPEPAPTWHRPGRGGALFWSSCGLVVPRQCSEGSMVVAQR